MATQSSAPEPQIHIHRHRVDVGWRTFFLMLGAVATIWLFGELWPVLLLIVVSLVLVGTLHPVVLWLERRPMPRVLALAIAFLALAGSLTVIGLVTLPALFGQLAGMLERAPEHQAALVAWLGGTASTRGLAGMVSEIDAQRLAPDLARTMLGYTEQIFLVIGGGITAIFLALYLIAEREAVQGAVYAATPRRYHLRLARVLFNLETIVGGYIRGQVLTSAMMTTFTLILLLVLDVPDALAFAVFAGITDALPLIGGLMGGAPIVLAAFAAGGPGVAVVALIAFVIYQELENRIIVPRVYGRVLRLPASVVIVAILAGAALLGIVGALLALPVAAAMRMLIKELRVELPGDDTDETALRARDEAAEDRYEELSAGEPAVVAAQIANELAERIRDSDAPGAPADAAEVPITGGDDAR